MSMQSFVVSVSRRVIIDYISSPEVGFLKSIAARFKASKTKLIFRFLEPDVTEPSTNRTYAALLKNLTFIKTFASGILIPKYYIWPTDTSQYLLPHTSVVLDAHGEGLEVYASDFENDVLLSYNYSYDPLAESLSYINNGDFSVDGMVTGFPITPSQAVGKAFPFRHHSYRIKFTCIVKVKGILSTHTFPTMWFLFFSSIVHLGVLVCTMMHGCVKRGNVSCCIVSNTYA